MYQSPRMLRSISFKRLYQQKMHKFSWSKFVKSFHTCKLPVWNPHTFNTMAKTYCSLLPTTPLMHKAPAGLFKIDSNLRAECSVFSTFFPTDPFNVVAPVQLLILWVCTIITGPHWQQHDILSGDFLQRQGDGNAASFSGHVRFLLVHCNTISLQMCALLGAVELDIICKRSQHHLFL